MKTKSIHTRNILLIIFCLFFVDFQLVAAQKKVQINDRESYFKTADSFYQKGNWEEGKKTADEGLKKYSNDSDLKMLLGKYHIEKQHFDLARYELKKALEFNPKNTAAKQHLINVEIATQRYSSAICYVNELLEGNPYAKKLWKKKIDIYDLQGNDVEANRLRKRLIQIFPEDPDVQEGFVKYMKQEAYTKEKEGEIYEVLELSKDILEEEPKNEELYLLMINDYLRLGNYDDALATAEQGVYNLPLSTQLMDKKIGILSDLKRYDEMLSFLQTKIKSNDINKEYLQKKYDYYLTEAARHYKMTDPYMLYRVILERTPRDEEAFKFVVDHALANGFYDDALDAVKKAKKARGETKNILVREREIYDKMGATSKKDQVTIRLYQLYPQDADVEAEYTLYKFNQAKNCMEDKFYGKAIEHLKFVAAHGDWDMVKAAHSAMHNCFYELGKWDEAVAALDSLISNYPQEAVWRQKKAIVYRKQGKYSDALKEYEKGLSLTDSVEFNRVIAGEDELVASYIKQLVENYLLTDAIRFIDYWLTINPHSESALHYGINVAAQMNDYEKMMQYALLGLKNNPQDVYYQTKQAEAFLAQKEYRKSLDILAPNIKKNPYNQMLINAYSQSSEDYAEWLMKEAKPHESLMVLDSALIYDPNNKSLKYWKGVVYEKIHDNDSAFYYQSFYEPSFLEAGDFEKHLQFLKSKNYKNQLNFYYWRSRFGDEDRITSISTLEYTRFATNNAITGTLNYSGREEGRGMQMQLEWNHTWNADFYTTINVAAGDKFFPFFATKITLYKSLKNDWGIELGAGYRRLSDKTDLFIVTPGVSKQLGDWALRGYFNSLVLDSKWYYNLSAETRYHVSDIKSYVFATGSLGSAPDIAVIDNQLYNALAVTNVMLGMGARYQATNNLSLGLLGNWYNYQDKKEHHRDLYSLHFQIYVNF